MNGSAQAGKQEQWAWYTKSVVDAIGKNASPRVKQALYVCAALASFCTGR